MFSFQVYLLVHLHENVGFLLKVALVSFFFLSSVIVFLLLSFYLPHLLFSSLLLLCTSKYSWRSRFHTSLVLLANSILLMIIIL